MHIGHAIETQGCKLPGRCYLSRRGEPVPGRENSTYAPRGVWRGPACLRKGGKLKVTGYSDEVSIIRSELLKGLTCYAGRYEVYLTGKESHPRLFRWKMTWPDVCFEMITSGNFKEKIRDWSQSDALERSGSSLAEEVRGTWIHASEVRMKRAEEKLGVEWLN